jgi:hypothetical protein
LDDVPTIPTIDLDRARELLKAAAVLAPSGGPIALLLAEALAALEPRATGNRRAAAASSATMNDRVSDPVLRHCLT